LNCPPVGGLREAPASQMPQTAHKEKRFTAHWSTVKRFFCRLFGEAAKKLPDFWEKTGKIVEKHSVFSFLGARFHGHVTGGENRSGALVASKRQGTKATPGEFALEVRGRRP